MRLHVLEDGSASWDVPSSKLWELPLEAFEQEGKHVTFQRVNSQGQRWVFRGTLREDLIEGEIEFDGQAYGDFHLHRSSEPLRKVDPESYADAEGLYRFPSGRSIALIPRAWGEMRYFDSVSGRYATLFPVSRERFFAGSAMYIPAPVSAWAEVVRDAAGEVVALRWQDVGSAAEHGRRVERIEEEVQFTSDGTMLKGTLMKPETAGPHPAAVVLGGSGWGGRDDVRFDGRLLSAAGLAVLIYDKRGHAESDGDQVVPYARTAADALAAVRYLESRSDIRTGQVGLTGRSRGGWFAPLAASRSKDVAFLVLFVAPAVSPAQQEHTRRLNAMRDAGYSEAEVAEGEAYLELLWEYIRTSEGWDAYAVTRERMEQKGWLEYLHGPASADPQEWEWSRLNMHYDPVPALETVTCPVLALFGELDGNVVPAINMPPMQEAFERAGNDDASFVVVPGADHSLRLANDDGEPLHHKRGYPPDFWQTVYAWLHQRLGIVEGAGSEPQSDSR
jgi:dienelactone hydrolase